MTVEQLVSRQIDAYNDRDIEAMMTVFSEDVKIMDFASGKVLTEGWAACRQMYEELFRRSPLLHAEILSTIRIGRTVILHEYVSGRNGNAEKMEQVVIFETGADRITRITIIR